jgi:hypothetical protein
VQGLPAKVSGTTGKITLHGTAAWIILGSRLYATQTSQSWAREPVSCPPGYAMAAAAAYSTQQVTLLCTGDSGMGSQGKILYSSSDGGASFTLMGKAPTGGDQFDQLAQPAAQHIFIAAFSALTLLDVSGDGGRTWSTALNINDGGLGWSDFCFTTPAQGAAIYGNVKVGGQFSDCRAPFDISELVFCVTDMSVTLTSRPGGSADERFRSGGPSSARERQDRERAT